MQDKRGAVWKTCLNIGESADEQQMIERILSGRVVLEKMRGFPIYKTRINRPDGRYGDRLLFVDKGEGVLVFFKRLEKHHYNRLNKKVVKQFLARLGLEEEALEDDERFTVDADDESKVWPTISYYNRQLLFLDRDQEDIFNHQPPLVIKGEAGSGKTLLIYEWIIKLLDMMPEEATKEILYVAENAELVERINRYLRERLAHHPRGHLVQAMTYEALSRQQDSVCRDLPAVGYAEFEQWLLGRNNANWAFLKQDPKRAYEGLREVSAYMHPGSRFNADNYLTTNSKRGLYVENKDALLAVYIAYRDYLMPAKKLGQSSAGMFWDPALYDWQAGSRYHAIFVDEAPDLSPMQWWVLYDLVEETALGQKQIYFAGDPSYQRLQDRQSLCPLMVSLMSQLDGGIREITLTGSYRCPNEVLTFAHELGRIRNLGSAGTFGRGESPITLNKLIDKSGELRQVGLGSGGIDELNQALMSPDCCVLTRERSRKRARARFPIPGMIFTPQEIKGQDYDRVILFEMLWQGRDDIELRTLAVGEQLDLDAKSLNPFNPVLIKQPDGDQYYLLGCGRDRKWSYKRLDKLTLLPLLAKCQLQFPEHAGIQYVVDSDSLNPLHQYFQTLGGHVCHQDEELKLLEKQLKTVPDVNAARRDHGRCGDEGDDRVITYINDVITAVTRTVGSLWFVFENNKLYPILSQLLMNALMPSTNQPNVKLEIAATEKLDVDGWKARIEILQEANLTNAAQEVIQHFGLDNSYQMVTKNEASMDEQPKTTTKPQTKKNKSKKTVGSVDNSFSETINESRAQSSEIGNQSFPKSTEQTVNSFFSFAQQKIQEGVHQEILNSLPKQKAAPPKAQTYILKLLQAFTNDNVNVFMRHKKALVYMKYHLDTEEHKALCFLEVILTDKKRSILFLNILEQHPHMINALLDDFYLPDGQTIFHVAAKYNLGGLINILTCGRDPEKTGIERRTINGLTALYFSIYEEHLDATNGLLIAGASLTNVWPKGTQKFRMVIDYSSEDYLNQINERKSLNFPDATPLFVAARHGNSAVTAMILKQDCSDLEKPVGPCHAMPIHVAAQHNAIEVVKLLLDYGADVNSTMADGTTALFLAAQFGYIDLVKLLIKRGAHVIDDWHQPTRFHDALTAAADQGHEPIVTMLINAGADVGKIVYEGMSLLDMIDLRLSNIDINHNATVFETFRVHGFDVTRKSILHEQQRLQHYIDLMMKPTKCTLNTLFALGDVSRDFYKTVREPGGKFTVLIDYFFQNPKNADIFCEFLKQDLQEGAFRHSIFHKVINFGDNPFKTSFLHVAAFWNCTAFIELYFQYSDRIRWKGRSPMDRLNVYGLSPLYFAFKNHSMQAEQLLIEHGASLDIWPDKGQSPLCVAISIGDLSMIKLILSQSSGLLTINWCNQEGKRPLMVALEKYCSLPERNKSDHFSVMSDLNAFEVVAMLFLKGADQSGLDELIINFFDRARKNGIQKTKIDSLKSLSRKDGISLREFRGTLFNQSNEDGLRIENNQESGLSNQVILENDTIIRK